MKDDHLSSYLRAMEAQEILINKMFPFNSINNSFVRRLNQNDKLAKLNGATALSSAFTESTLQSHLRKISETSELAKLNRSASWAITESSVQLALQENSAVEKLRSVTSMSEKMNQLTSATALSRLFSEFRTQSQSVASIINPSVSSFINQSIRQSFENADFVSELETAYIDSFDLASEDYDETVQTEVREFTEALESNPTLKENFFKVVDGFKTKYLEDDFSAAVADVVGQYLSPKARKIFVLFILISYVFYVHLLPYINKKKEAEQQEKSEQLQNHRIEQLEGSADLKENLFGKMNGEIEKFEQELLKKYKVQTVTKYTRVASAFVHYIHDHTDYISFEEIKQSDTNSKFIATVKYDILEDFEKSEIQQKMKVFLDFLKQQGFQNGKIFK